MITFGEAGRLARGARLIWRDRGTSPERYKVVFLSNVTEPLSMALGGNNLYCTDTMARAQAGLGDWLYCEDLVLWTERRARELLALQKQMDRIVARTTQIFAEDEQARENERPPALRAPVPRQLLVPDEAPAFAKFLPKPKRSSLVKK